MNQRVENALRTALDRTTTGLDDNPTRFQEVAERFRRRRQRHAAGVAGVVLAVIAITAGLVLTIDGGSGRSSPAVEPGTIDCPPVVTGYPTPTASTQDGPLVPAGPIAARACGLIDVTLHLGMDRVVAALNALPPPTPVRLCTGEIAGPPYNLVLAYPDGGQVTARIDQGSCREVLVGDQIRVQVDGRIQDLLVELAEEQRLADAPADPPAPTCPDPATLTRPVGEQPTPPRYGAFVTIDNQSVPYPAAAVAVCRYSSTDPATATLVASRVVTDGAERARELVNGQGPEIPFWECEPPAGSWDVLVFADEAGGVYEVRIGRGECRLFYSAANLSDEPEPELQQWLDDTLGGPPPD